jgi:hypothetical protein
VGSLEGAALGNASVGDGVAGLEGVGLITIEFWVGVVGLL